MLTFKTLLTDEDLSICPSGEGAPVLLRVPRLLKCAREAHLRLERREMPC